MATHIPVQLQREPTTCNVLGPRLLLFAGSQLTDGEMWSLPRTNAGLASCWTVASSPKNCVFPQRHPPWPCPSWDWEGHSFWRTEPRWLGVAVPHPASHRGPGWGWGTKHQLPGICKPSPTAWPWVAPDGHQVVRSTWQISLALGRNPRAWPRGQRGQLPRMSGVPSLTLRNQGPGRGVQALPPAHGSWDAVWQPGAYLRKWGCVVEMFLCRLAPLNSPWTVSRKLLGDPVLRGGLRIHSLWAQLPEMKLTLG